MIRLCIAPALLALMLAGGCGQEPASDTTNDKPVIALIMKSLANEFFTRMADGARDHNQSNQARYELIVNGIKDESDLAQQVALVEQMIARGVNVIVIAPADSKALVPILKRAIDAGIVVINIDNKLDDSVLEERDARIPFVGPDNRAGARLVGEHLAATLHAGDQVAIIGGISTAYNAQQRQKGFEDAMAAGDIAVVSVQTADWQQAKASTIAAALMTEHRQLRALLCSNDNMAIGAAAAVRQAGKSGQVQIVGFDNIAASHELLRDGQMLATAEQYAADLAVFGIEYALEVLDGGAIPADKTTPVKLVTRDDIE